MNARSIVAFAVAALLFDTASAQIVDNFEIDDFAVNDYREHRWMWWGNSNLTRIPGHTQPEGCYFVPGRLNTAVGDAVLSTERGSLIYKLLSSLGQTHSHSGMARDSQTIRHNTMTKGQLDYVSSGGIPQYLKATGDGGLREGQPGTITHSVEAAVSYREFNLLDGLVMHSSKGPAGWLDTRAAERSKAWAEMNDFRGWYRLYAYTNMTWNDPYTRASNDGNMCSGSVFHAHHLAGNRLWSWDMRRSYAANVRQSAAARLYSDLYHELLDSPAYFESFALAFNDLLGGTSYRDFVDRAANQVVNCMAFNDCGNRTSRWRGGVGSGRTLSPNDLQTLASVAAFAAAWTGTENTFVYDASKPLAKTGDYFCCINRETNNLLGGTVYATTCDRRF
jgi:hypothetical protein